MIRPGMTMLQVELHGAGSVSLAHSMDGYILHPARKTSDSNWAVAVPAGTEFRYFLIVDGTFYLPDCRFREKDDFGSENCIYMPTVKEVTE